MATLSSRAAAAPSGSPSTRRARPRVERARARSRSAPRSRHRAALRSRSRAGGVVVALQAGHGPGPVQGLGQGGAQCRAIRALRALRAVRGVAGGHGQGAPPGGRGPRRPGPGSTRIATGRPPGAAPEPPLGVSRISGAGAPVQGRPYIVLLRCQAGQPGSSPDAGEVRGSLFGEADVVAGVAPAGPIRLARLGELLQAELADGLQHGESWLAGAGEGAQEALIGQGGERLQEVLAGRRRGVGKELGWVARGGHSHRPVQGEGAGEDGQAPAEGLLCAVQEVVAPGDGLAQGLLAGGEVARAPGQEAQRGPVRPFAEAAAGSPGGGGA